jgi:hypothetical protein
LETAVVGRMSYEVSKAAYRIGYLRIFRTVKPLGTAVAAETGDLLNYEFENSLNDTSGNNRHLVANQTPVFVDTP